MLSAKKRPGGTRGTRTQGGPTAMPPAWPRLALLPPPPQLPSRNTSHYFTPRQQIPPHPPHPDPSFPAPVRHATPPSPPIPSIRPLDHPSATLLAHAVVCLLGNKLWLVYGGTLSFDIHTHTHTHTHIDTHTHPIPLQRRERPEKYRLDTEREERERE